jgi:hypothetical protein
MKSGPSGEGVSASASKNETKPKGKEVLECVQIEQAENGGFSVEQRYTIEPPAGVKKYDCYPSYVEPKTFVFTDFAGLSAHLASLYGGAGK